MAARAPSIGMRLLRPVLLAGIQYTTGAVVVLSVDAARHLHHLQRAVPANRADLGRLLDAPRVLQR